MADVSVQASVSKRDVATQTEHDTHPEAEQKTTKDDDTGIYYAVRVVMG